MVGLENAYNTTTVSPFWRVERSVLQLLLLHFVVALGVSILAKVVN